MTGALQEIACRLTRPAVFCSWVFDRLFDPVLDRRFGIRSSQRKSLVALGLDAPDRVGYQPISYLDFAPMMSGIDRSGTLVDFGSGKGRVVCLAAVHGFARVVGVELSPLLCKIADDNLKRRKTGNAAVVCADAITFEIPPDATTFTFINPFGGEILRRVLRNIVESNSVNPRRFAVLAYGSPVNVAFFKEFESCEGLQVLNRVVLPTGCVALHLGPV